MAIDAMKLPNNVYDDITQNCRIEDFEYMSVPEAFDLYLRWHGIIGYSDMLISAYEAIKKAEVK